MVEGRGAIRGLRYIGPFTLCTVPPGYGALGWPQAPLWTFPPQFRAGVSERATPLLRSILVWGPRGPGSDMSDNVYQLSL